MSLLSGLESNEVVSELKDSLGTSFLVNSGLQNMIIDMAYLDKSAGGALSLNLHFKNNSALIRQTLWVTSGDKKGNKSTYKDKSGKLQYLPGYNQAEAISLLTLGKKFSTLDHEDKVIKRWDVTLKKEIPQTTKVITELLNQPITVGFIKVVEDKTIKDNNGNYVASGETREVNEINKLFRAADGLTLSEVRSGVTTAEFKDKWADKWEGEVKNRAKGNNNNSGVVNGVPSANLSNNNNNNLFS